MSDINSKKKISTWSLSGVILQLCVVFSVFSQIDSVERFARPGMYIMWIITLVLGCYKNRGKLRMDGFSKRFLLAYITFYLLCMVTGIFDEKHFSANYIRVLLIPLFVTFAGSMFADLDEKLFDRMGKLYLISSVIFALWVQRTYIPSYSSWLNTRMYLFQEKNSAGQIWVAAILISVLLLKYKNISERIIVYIACGYLLIMTGICQCRTALLGLGVAIISFVIYRSKKKLRWIIVIIIFVIITWSIPVTRRFIEQAFFLNKYTGADLNTFSSGRLVKYEKALSFFVTSPLVGVGKYYVDSSFILILTESGVFGFLIIEWIWITKIIQNFKFRGQYEERVFLFMITIFYIVESILEGYPPFGPGVSSFMFWFVGSILIARRTETKKTYALV